MSSALAWQPDGDRWYGELVGREHDYGRGSESDVFCIWLERDADGWSVTVEHASRGGAGMPVGLVPELSAEAALAKAAELAERFRRGWEAEAEVRAGG